MAWISRNGYLNQSEMENNANIVISYFRSQGVNDVTIAAILGNMQAESTINPNLEEVGGQGYGLVQWTPVSVLQNHCSTLGISPYTDGDVQLQCLIPEITGNPASVREWYTSSNAISRYYNSGATSDMITITGAAFLTNIMGWNADKLAVLFMAAYERPSYDPSINHYQLRQQYALEWANYIGLSTFTPRLDDTGMVGNFHYYSENPYYQSGYGLPNCTAFAWREIF